MKAISLHQPWASAVAFGVKTIETRGWRTNHLGPIAIHAAKRKTPGQCGIYKYLIATHDDILLAFSEQMIAFEFDDLPFGAVIATAQIRAVGNMSFLDLEKLSDAELALGDYSAGRFFWKLTDVVKLQKPIPAIGHQGFFNVEL